MGTPHRPTGRPSRRLDRTGNATQGARQGDAPLAVVAVTATATATTVASATLTGRTRGRRPRRQSTGWEWGGPRRDAEDAPADRPVVPLTGQRLAWPSRRWRRRGGGRRRPTGGSGEKGRGGRGGEGSRHEGWAGGTRRVQERCQRNGGEGGTPSGDGGGKGGPGWGRGWAPPQDEKRWAPERWEEGRGRWSTHEVGGSEEQLPRRRRSGRGRTRHPALLLRVGCNGTDSHWPPNSAFTRDAPSGRNHLLPDLWLPWRGSRLYLKQCCICSSFANRCWVAPLPPRAAECRCGEAPPRIQLVCIHTFARGRTSPAWREIFLVLMADGAQVRQGGRWGEGGPFGGGYVSTADTYCTLPIGILTLGCVSRLSPQPTPPHVNTTDDRSAALFAGIDSAVPAGRFCAAGAAAAAEGTAAAAAASASAATAASATASAQWV